MNQVIRVGDGILVLVDYGVTREAVHNLQRCFTEKFPGVSVGVFGPARYVELPGEDPGGMFTFEGKLLSQEVFDEFRRWWTERQGG